MEVLIKVRGQVATCQENITLTASSGVLTAVFDFDESWDGMAKTALFTRNGVTETRLLRDDKCLVPDDVIKNGGLVVSVVGAVDGKILTTTNQCAVILHLSGYIPGISIGKPDENVYTGILDLMAEHNQKAKDISENTDKAIEAQRASEKARDEAVQAADSVKDKVADVEAAQKAADRAEKAAKTAQDASASCEEFSEKTGIDANNAKSAAQVATNNAEFTLIKANEARTSASQASGYANEASISEHSAKNYADIARQDANEATAAKLGAQSFANKAQGAADEAEMLVNEIKDKKYATEDFVLKNGGKINSFSVNGNLQEIDENKNVDIIVPTKTSDLANNSGFITNVVNNLVNYYSKSETLTRDEINQKLTAIPKFSIEPVDSLPTSNISITTVYLLKSGDETDNLYTEYIYANGKWEILGKQTVDLSNYYKKGETYSAQQMNTMFLFRTDVVNVLNSDDQEKALSASMGYTLNQNRIALEDRFLKHQNNNVIHITSEERTAWNKNTTDINQLSEEIADLPTGVSVKKFGAVGDGTADDTQAIQDAVNSGQEVFFPVGTYKITAPINIPSNCTIKGTLNSKIVGNGTVNGLVIGDGINNVRIDTLVVTSCGHALDISGYNCAFDNLLLDYSNVGCCINISAYANYFNNCSFKFNTIGIEGRCIFTSTFRECQIYRNSQYGIKANLKVVTISGGYIEENGIDKVDGTMIPLVGTAGIYIPNDTTYGTAQVFFSGVDFENNGECGILHENQGRALDITFMSGQFTVIDHANTKAAIWLKVFDKVQRWLFYGTKFPESTALVNKQIAGHPDGTWADSSKKPTQIYTNRRFDSNNANLIQYATIDGTIVDSFFVTDEERTKWNEAVETINNLVVLDEEVF